MKKLKDSLICKVLAICLVGASALIGSTVSARAQMVTFAQFSDGGGNSYTFTNTGTGGTFTGSSEGYLTFFVPGQPQGEQLVDITLTSTAVTASQTAQLFPGVDLLAQPIDGADNTLTFTSVADGTDLLTVTFSGSLVGIDGDVNASISPPTMTFTSQVLNFAGSGTTDGQIDVSAINPGLTQNANGFADSFTGDLTGGFTADVAPVTLPEPSVASLLALGFVVAVIVRASRRRAARS